METNELSVWSLMDAAGEPIETGFSLEYLKGRLEGMKSGDYYIMEFSVDPESPDLLRHDPDHHFRYSVHKRGNFITARLDNRNSYLRGIKVKLESTAKL